MALNFTFIIGLKLEYILLLTLKKNTKTMQQAGLSEDSGPRGALGAAPCTVRQQRGQDVMIAQGRPESRSHESRKQRSASGSQCVPQGQQGRGSFFLVFLLCHHIF